jgi:hypothetical protein
MTAAEIVQRVRISDVAEALGVKLNRTRRRAIASWREGRHFSVSLDDGKNVWHDFVSGQGGGVVDLIVRIRGCDRKEALAWLSDFAGVPLDQQSDNERRHYAHRLHLVKPQAERLVAWKFDTLEALRCQRNRLMRIYHSAVRFVRSHTFDECAARADLRYELALNVGESYWCRVIELDEQIDRLEDATYEDLLRRFRGVA